MIIPTQDPKLGLWIQGPQGWATCIDQILRQVQIHLSSTPRAPVWNWAVFCIEGSSWGCRGTSCILPEVYWDFPGLLVPLLASRFYHLSPHCRLGNKLGSWELPWVWPQGKAQSDPSTTTVCLLLSPQTDCFSRLRHRVCPHWN